MNVYVNEQPVKKNLTWALWNAFLDWHKSPCLRLKWKWKRIRERKVIWKRFQDQVAKSNWKCQSSYREVRDATVYVMRCSPAFFDRWGDSRSISLNKSWNVSHNYDISYEQLESHFFLNFLKKPWEWKNLVDNNSKFMRKKEVSP